VSTTVCLAGNSIHYPAQLWPYLNWALSLRSAGCEVVWLETLEQDASSAPATLTPEIAALRSRLEHYGLADTLVLASADGEPIEPLPAATMPLEAALAADVLLDLAYLPRSFVEQFRRSVFVDLDPGETQIWVAAGELDVSGHDVHISIGEGVEVADRPFPDGGLHWTYVPSPVALDVWTADAAHDPGAGAPYTTISHWWEDAALELNGEWVENSKRAGFEPFLALPSLSPAKLELALGGLDDEDERRSLESHGWIVRDAEDVVATPAGYRDYVHASRGELTAVKPPYVLLRSGWLNERTASYLAAGKPAIIQRTLPQRDSRLPDDEGLLRFETLSEAAAALERVESDYEFHARRARALAEEHFDGSRIATRVVELALG
jgi:hypothetical protein